MQNDECRIEATVIGPPPDSAFCIHHSALDSGKDAAMSTSLLPVGPWKGLAGCVLVLLAALCPSGCGNKVAPPPPEPTGPPVVRVLIRNDVDSVKLVATTQPVVRTCTAGGAEGDSK